MKKYALLLLAGSMVAMASCGNEENTTTTEQIDSMATYRTDTMEAALRAQNDSLINELARMRADSAMKATNSGAAVTTAPGASSTTSSRNTRSTTKTTTKTNSQPVGTRVNDRPGATDTRPNNSQTETPKPVTDRPGATNVNR